MNDAENAQLAGASPSAETPQRSCRRIRLFVLAPLFVLGMFALAWHVLSESASVASSDQRTATLTVTTVTPHEALWPVTLTASGSIAPWQEASIGAQVGGYQLVEVRVDVGDHVRRGDVLARVDSALLRAEEAQLLANHEQAIADERRALALQREGAISDQEVLQFITAAKVSAALLESKRLQLRYTDVIAPDDGVISARSATLGAVTAIGEELFRLIRRGRLEWRGELTAAQLANVSQGQRVELELPDGSRAAAIVREIAPTLDERSRLGVVYADIETGSHARAGMYANGHVVVAKKPAMIVPAEAVVIRDGRTYVVKLTEASAMPIVTLQPVTVARRRNDAVEIVEGLSGDELLVQAGAGFLSDGDIVRLADARTSELAFTDRERRVP